MNRRKREIEVKRREKRKKRTKRTPWIPGTGPSIDARKGAGRRENEHQVENPKGEEVEGRLTRSSLIRDASLTESH
jgi:hypothetical protein